MTDKLVEDLKLALGDAYTIERELMGGGMSRVFVAKEHALGREVVIKVLPPDLAAGVNRERFRREVQLAARLSHPYIVPLLSAGEHGELLWFTMPFIPGESLRTRLQRQGKLQVAETVRLLHDVVEALAYAHSRGVIHRDIKPGNILSDGLHGLVTDFGVAKALSAALPAGGAGHTASGMAIGTPAYMAPEQLAADPTADHRVDIYAVGLLAYELLSGVSPFQANSPTATMTAQLTRVPEPLHNSRPNVPPALSDLIQRCLAKNADERPPDAHAVLADLDRISGALAAETHREASGENSTGARASSIPLAIAAAAVMALVMGGVYFAKQSNAPKPNPVHVDTLLVRAGRDSGNPEELKIPAKAMTHADSLKIAEALRDELAPLEPTDRKTGAPVTPATPLSQVQLDKFIAQTDSIVRVRLAEANTRRGPPPGFDASRGDFTPRDRTGSPPPAPGNTMSAAAPSGAPTQGTPKKVLVLAIPSRGGADTSLVAIQRAAVTELTGRLKRIGSWELVTLDTMMFTGRNRGGNGGGGGGGNEAAIGAGIAAGRAAASGRGSAVTTIDRSGASATMMLGSLSGLGNADVTVMVSMQRNGPDSASFRFTIRNATPPYGYRVISSNAVYHPTSVDPYRNTIRDAARVLEDLRQLPAGQSWQLDQGRGGGRGGPRPDGMPGYVEMQIPNRAIELRRAESLKVVPPVTPAVKKPPQP